MKHAFSSTRKQPLRKINLATECRPLFQSFSSRSILGRRTGRSRWVGVELFLPKISLATCNRFSAIPGRVRVRVCVCDIIPSRDGVSNKICAWKNACCARACGESSGIKVKNNYKRPVRHSNWSMEMVERKYSHPTPTVRPFTDWGQLRTRVECCVLTTITGCSFPPDNGMRSNTNQRSSANKPVSRYVARQDE